MADNHCVWKSLPRICLSYDRWRDDKPSPGSMSAEPELCWPQGVAIAYKTSPLVSIATATPFGILAPAINRVAWRPCLAPSCEADVLGRFPPLQRAQIVELACLEPIAQGLHITHWSSEDLAREAVREGIVEQISSRTVRRILSEVDLQPHRTRYWKTSKIDPEFKSRASQVLWCYANAARLAADDRWVVCVDEVPNFQILERPIRRGRPGNVEQQEHEYKRHGVASMLFFLIVHTGEMKLTILKSKTAKTFIEQLQRFREEHSELKRLFLIHDGDPSHTAAATRAYLDQDDWWRPRRTPVHASWLDQAEILINMFKRRYLVRQSWPRRQDFLAHVNAAWPEYNERYAHPINWTWTAPKMREWYEKHKD